MKNERLPVIWVGALELHGDLFFASLEYHDMVETLPVIHNYALTYALDLSTAENGRVTPLYWSSERRKQQPRYTDDFAALIQAGTYVTPAKSLEGLPPTTIRQYASRIDEYLHAQRKIDDVLSWEKNPAKRGLNTLASLFPLHGYMKVITAGARFVFYIYNPPPDFPKRRYIRLGKFNTKASVTFEPCREVATIDSEQVTTHPVNTQDVSAFAPLNILFMRPSPLATVAQLANGDALRVTHSHFATTREKDKLFTTFLPRTPAYSKVLTGEANAPLSNSSRKTTSKQRTRR